MRLPLSLLSFAVSAMALSPVELPSATPAIIGSIDTSSISRPMPLAPAERHGSLAPRVPLRGGFAPLPKDAGSKFLSLSAAFTTLFGICVIAYPECAFKYMLFLQSEPASSDLVREMMGCAMVAWGCAKVTAIRQGEQACAAFCRLNTLPMTLLVGTMIKNRAGPFATAAMSLFLAACGVFGFL